MKKRFDSPAKAKSIMYAIRRAGYDSYCKGAVCYINEPALPDFLSIFDGWEEM